jgi:citrate lyase subunit beta/citryl-CoA lyase
MPDTSLEDRADSDRRDLPSGAAGRTGEDVRADLLVRVTAADGGGIEVTVASKVAAYYGDALRDQARATLLALGVEHARVELDDRGALPFTVGARIEAAARRAGLTAGPAAPAGLPGRPASDRERLRRSRLYLPGNEPKYMPSAGLHGPDAVILDLEDSVHPDEKDAARVLVREALVGLDFGAAERTVRINQGESGLVDLDEVVPAAPDLVLLPKVEDPEAVVAAADRIAAVHDRLGWVRPLWLMPILESARGVERAFEIACASDRVVALTLGLEDLTADLGVPRTASGEETLYARMRTVNAARAAGVQAIDSVWSDVQDTAGLLAWGQRSRALGFVGMGCIHPRQVRTIHEAFAPSQTEIERALRIAAAFREAEARGLGVVSLGSKMIDPPVVKRALRLVAEARAMGLVSDAEGRS